MSNATNRIFEYDKSNPRAAIGRPVYGNNIKQLGRIIEVEPLRPHCIHPIFVIRWANGKTEAMEHGSFSDLDRDVEWCKAELGRVIAARDKAMSINIR